jgi:hypothetical protein
MLDGPNWNKNRAKQHPSQRGRGRRGQMPGGSTSERLHPGEHGVSVGGGIPSGHTNLSPLRKFDLRHHWTALPPLSSMQAEKRASTPESSRLQAAGRSGRVPDLNDAAGSGARGRRRRRPDCVLGDRGYDAKAIRQGLRGRHMLPFSCEVQHRAWERAGPMAMGSRIERPFAWLNQFRRLRVRYENTCRHDMTTRCIP